MKLKRDFKLGLLSKAGTIKILAVLRDGLNGFWIMRWVLLCGGPEENGLEWTSLKGSCVLRWSLWKVTG